MLLEINSYNEGFANRIKIYINGVHQRFITSFDTCSGKYTQYANQDGKLLTYLGEPYIINSQLGSFDHLKLELERTF